MLPNTVQIIEILWVIAAMPGLWFWVVNIRTALQAKLATEELGTRDGASVWVYFSIEFTVFFTCAEIIFILIGILAMFLPIPPAATIMTRYVFGGLLILISLGITYEAFRWKRVHESILRMAAASKE